MQRRGTGTRLMPGTDENCTGLEAPNRPVEPSMQSVHLGRELCKVSRDLGRDGNVKQISDLIEEGADVNATDDVRAALSLHVP